MDRVGGPQLDGAMPEEDAGFGLGRLRQALEAPARWRQLRGDLRAVGIAAPERAVADDLHRLREVLWA
jgi:hypothetical protein